MWRVQTVDACVRLLLFALDRWVAPGDGRSVDDRRRGLAVDKKAVEQPAVLVDRAEIDLEVEAVLAGDPMAPRPKATNAAPTVKPMAAPYKRLNASLKVAAVGPPSVDSQNLKRRAVPSASAPERTPPIAMNHVSKLPLRPSSTSNLLR
jgi:hypothetical protein